MITHDISLSGRRDLMRDTSWRAPHPDGRMSVITRLVPQVSLNSIGEGKRVGDEGCGAAHHDRRRDVQPGTANRLCRLSKVHDGQMEADSQPSRFLPKLHSHRKHTRIGRSQVTPCRRGTHMKTLGVRSTHVLLVTVAALGVAASAEAQQIGYPITGFYIGAAGGVNLKGNEAIKNLSSNLRPSAAA